VGGVLGAGGGAVAPPPAGRPAPPPPRPPPPRDDVAWMRSMIPQANELHAQGARGHVERQGKSLLALADASARAAGLSGALKRVEPTGGNSVRVSFEIANFDVLVDWLSQLARDYGVRVSDFSTDKVEGLGLVNARVTLEEGQR
jgi:general secretion pathway protein M